MLRGFVREGLTIDSQILGRATSYGIYLPYDYETSVRSYPVIYLLHGNRADYMSWVYFGEVNLIVDECISTRKIPPVILVMPDAGNSRYINNYAQSIRYEDFFLHEFIPEIESKFRIKSDRWFRGILGLSMGGYGALIYTIKYPNIFSACVTFSASIYTDEMTISMTDEQWNLNRGLVHGVGLQGKARLTEHYKSYDPFRLVENVQLETLKSFKLYLDCGDKDFRNDGNAALHILLRRLEIPHEYRVRGGGHTWSYWRNGLENGFKFIGDTFRRN